MLDAVKGASWGLCRRGDGAMCWFQIPVLLTTEELQRWRKASDPSKEQADIKRSQPPVETLVALGYKRIQLARLRTGYLVAKVVIDKKPLRLVVDTGSPRTHLDR